MYYIYERAIEKYQINTSTTAEKICVQPEGDCRESVFIFASRE